MLLNLVHVSFSKFQRILGSLISYLGHLYIACMAVINTCLLLVPQKNEQGPGKQRVMAWQTGASPTSRPHDRRWPRPRSAVYVDITD